jgi:hypothetical protein
MATTAAAITSPPTMTAAAKLTTLDGMGELDE